MAETVRAAVQTGPRGIEIREFPRPEIGPDDGLLRVEANGICGSDVETYKGHLGYGDRGPFIPGHEPLGVIEEIGERAAARWGVEPGDRVALEVIVPCHACQQCLTGRYQSCPNRKYGHGVTGIDVEPAIWGGLAEYLYLSPGSVLHRIERSVPVEVAAMFNPLGAGVRWAAGLGGVRLGDTVLVLGCGQRGLASVIAARAAGAGTIIVTGLESDEHKLALAREFGADHTIFADSEHTVEKVADLTGGAMADVTLELTPMAAAPVADALLATRHGGRVVLAGLKGGKEIPLRTDLIVNRALQIFGAFGVDATANEQAIAIIESGRFPLEKLHTHTFGLDDTALAIETLAGEVPGEQAVHVSVHPHL
ncbi:threonine dehydrogenase-like Zn-dependent dehydrogenase [Amycolatopsis bartoniae]|uniref:Putative alcohol dehydrogenase adh n=1 Tax=Amycolatopsis bartoniae TaxID=941986 RepID=A0A8H9IWM9_9PSEU|nr:alcohol dehydrogenase catalytic domain-containing protein [Amycolatopsis bartoniae]MBB2936726.1 threonine dehydrogenase-like Zn-dependent dehydrogenase [Amycolatopsis bartoniae]TVT09220.1 zinc-binding dehydrogenase [Amycolatopsis bartoniae]GHF49729.1 putative alcohol dehydrogenase adh [Amycolatopsis bartoniae]